MFRFKKIPLLYYGMYTVHAETEKKRKEERHSQKWRGAKARQRRAEGEPPLVKSTGFPYDMRSSVMSSSESL